MVSVGAQQRGSPERKRELVLATFELGAEVNAVARRNLGRHQPLFAWAQVNARRLAEAVVPASAPRFLPLAIAARSARARASQSEPPHDGGRRAQCDMSSGMAAASSTALVAPPSKNSRVLEWPYPPITSKSALAPAA